MAEGATEQTVAFVDLAGFTALTETHGDEQAADLAEKFVALTQQALGPDDRLVKSIGDAVMLASPSPAAGLEVVGRLLTACHDASGFPIPRAGLHHGSIVERGGDVFGATVNLAARVAGQASGGQVLGTLAVAAAARDAGLPATSVGHVELRNISSAVELFDIELGGVVADHLTVDPVCRMQVEPAHAAGRLHHEGSDWWFCSLECAAIFAQDPAAHVGTKD